MLFEVGISTRRPDRLLRIFRRVPESLVANSGTVPKKLITVVFFHVPSISWSHHLTPHNLCNWKNVIKLSNKSINSLDLYSRAAQFESQQG
jgi:hypothetical protein